MLLLSCGTDTKKEEKISYNDIMQKAANTTYDDVFGISNNKRLKTNKDSCLQFIYYSENEEFNKAIKVAPKPIRNDSLLTKGLTRMKARVMIGERDFENYNSVQFLALGEYYCRIFDSPLKTYDIYLRESLKMDNNNIYALFAQIRLKLSSGEFNKAHVLMKKFLSIDHNDIIKELYAMNKDHINQEVCKTLTLKKIINTKMDYVGRLK